MDNSEKPGTGPLMQARARIALDFPIVDILRKIQDSQIKSFQQNRPFAATSNAEIRAW